MRGWFTGRLPGDWFTAAPDIQADREEITIVGVLPAPETAGASDAERAAAAEGRIRRFREETRSRRIEIAREAEHKFRRKVSWGVTCADVTEMFTTLSVPVMTRLRQPERRVLDTLVEAGVARSRSDALAWCVRLTGENADAWLARLRDALRHVEEVRDQGPGERLIKPGNWSRPLVYTRSRMHKWRLASQRSIPYRPGDLRRKPSAIIFPIPGRIHEIVPGLGSAPRVSMRAPARWPACPRGRDRGRDVCAQEEERQWRTR